MKRGGVKAQAWIYWVPAEAELRSDNADSAVPLHFHTHHGLQGQNGGTERQWMRCKEEKRRQQNQLGKKIKLFLNGKQTKKYYIRVQILQEGEKLHSIKIFFLVVVVIINQIVTEQRIGVKAKPWQESQQSNETQVSEMSLWGVPPKHGRHTGTRQPRYWHFS